MPSEVHFTRAQKWDLVRISAAAMASMVFFTAPLFLVRPQGATSQTDERPASPIALAAVSDTQAPVVQASNTTPPRSVPETATVSVVTSTEFAIVTAPALQSSTAALRSRTGKPAQLRARATAPPPSPSLSRRLARFIAGSGKYNVRPFPTVTTSGS